MIKYDYLIVGAGLFGSTCARLLTDAGFKVLVIEKRNHVGGNIYTGPIDELFDYCYGPLEYRSLRFIQKKVYVSSFQRNTVVNYTSHNRLYTRTIEHKYFENQSCEHTIISEEYPEKWVVGKERFSPVNDEANDELFKKYYALAENNERIILGGR